MGGTSLSEASGDVCWMGSHFHNCIDFNGGTFSIELLVKNEVAHFRIFGVRKFFIFTVSKRTRMFVL